MNFSNAARPFFATRFLICPSFTSMLQVAAVCAGVFGFVASAKAATNNFVLGWGYNSSGQSSPIPAAANSDVKTIASGYSFTVALKNDGSLIAWGQNTYGQCLGTNASGNRITTTPTGSPVQFMGQVITGVTEIAGGESQTIALKNGTVLGWGYNSQGQCLGTNASGNAITSIPNGASGNSRAGVGRGRIVSGRRGRFPAHPLPRRSGEQTPGAGQGRLGLVAASQLFR